MRLHPAKARPAGTGFMTQLGLNVVRPTATRSGDTSGVASQGTKVWRRRQAAARV